MVRKITASLYTTVDGRGAFPEYPGWDRTSNEPNLMWKEMWLNRFDDVTTVIMGRRSFLGHQKVWSEKARKKTDPQYLWDYSRYLDGVEKICLSNRLKKTDWENSRILKGDLAKIVAKLKKEKGGNIIAEGGPAVVREFLRLGLADDYWMVVQPVVYGKGPRYWTNTKGQATFRLLSSATMEDGELMLHYQSVVRNKSGRWIDKPA
jgi:dihydrofolate reductase